MSRKYTDGIPEGVALGTAASLGILVVGCRAISATAKFLEEDPELAKAVSVLSGIWAVVSIIAFIVLYFYRPLHISGTVEFFIVVGIWIMPFLSLLSFVIYKADQEKRTGKPVRIPFFELGEKAEVWEARMAAQRQHEENLTNS